MHAKKSASTLVFSRYCEEIANLLFWVIWAFLTTQRESDSIGLRKTLTFMCRHKINFIFHLFLGILQKSWKLIILGTLGINVYAYPKWYYQLVKNVCVYLQAKNQLQNSCFSGDNAKICKLLCTLKTIVSSCRKSLMFTHMPKIISSLTTFLRYYTLKNPVIWLANSPLAQEPEFCQIWDWWWNINNNISFRFRLFPGKTNDKVFQKIKTNNFWAILDLFCQNLEENDFFFW